MNVALSASVQGCLHNLGITVLTQENYFGAGRELSDSPGGLDPLQLWETDVQQN
jgi:hypothetical protein